MGYFGSRRGRFVDRSIRAMTVPGHLTWHDPTAPRAERWSSNGLTGATVWLTGLSGSGKSTIANALAEQLQAQGVSHYVLDGDNLRHGINADLGFEPADRGENVRRVGEIARLFADAGLVAIVPVISPYSEGRDRVRAAHAAVGLVFAEVHVDTPLQVCEARDPKGLYAKARTGELPGLTGVDAPYEAPVHPDLRLTPDQGNATEQAALVLDVLKTLMTASDATSPR